MNLPTSLLRRSRPLSRGLYKTASRPGRRAPEAAATPLPEARMDTAPTPDATTRQLLLEAIDLAVPPVRLEERTAPFAAWAANAERTDY